MTEPLAELLFPGDTIPKIADLYVHQLPWVHLLNAADAGKNLPDGLMVELILSGEVRVFERGQLVRAGRSQVLMSASNGYVREMSADYVAIRIIVDPLYLKYCLWPLVNSNVPLGPQENNAVVAIPESQDIRHDAQQLLNAMGSSRPYAAMIIRQLGRQLLLKLFLTETTFMPPCFFPDKTDRPAADIGYFLEASFTRKLTVQQLADAAGKSISAFKRDFGRMYEMAPLQWVIGRRLEYAFFLIRYTHYSIATIAQLSGFGDPAYFAAAYKRKFGISPLQSKLKGVY